MNKLSKTAGLLITSHVIISLIFIFFPSFLQESLLAKVYKHYLLPGPFFSENRITESNYLYLSWKTGNQWSDPINPSLTNFEKYLTGVNPRLLYQSRFERTLYQEWIAAKEKFEAASLVKLEDNLKRYYKATYVPGNSDSVKIVIVGKRTERFKIESDTLQIFKF